MPVRAEFALTHMAPTGECVGYDAHGQEIRVRGAVPGDVVVTEGHAQRGQRRRDFALQRPALERRAPPCAAQRECGGCALMPLGMEAQRRVKVEMLRAALGAAACEVPQLAWGDTRAVVAYRNRVRLRIDDGQIGFFNRAKRDDCYVLDRGLVQALAELQVLRERASREFASFTHCELRAPDLDGRPGLAFAKAESSSRGALRSVRELLPHFLVGEVNEPEIPCQRRKLTEDVEGLVPLDAFLQVNDAVNARLIDWVCAHVGSTGAARVLDLFAGAGNFSLPLAALGLRVTAIERHPASVAALRRASHAQGLACEALAASVEEALPPIVGTSRFDGVVIDAPRAGAGKMLSRVRELGSDWVVLCSCYAPGFARDLSVLCRAGYAIRKVVLWDMFPETHHLESVALLTRE